MAKLEIGKEYLDGTGEIWNIVATALNLDGVAYFLGVHYSTRSHIGMDARFFSESGYCLLSSRESGMDLLIFDWRELKRDDVVLVKSKIDPESSYARHVHSVDVENETVSLYGGGTSARTFKAGYNSIQEKHPASILGEVKSEV